jgi:hypothetical protein
VVVSVYKGGNKVRPDCSRRFQSLEGKSEKCGPTRDKWVV